MDKRLVINKEETAPINKVKVWQLDGWSFRRVKRLIEQKQAEARAAVPEEVPEK